MPKPAEQQIILLLTQVLKIAKHMVKAPANKTNNTDKTVLPRGIYPAKSKYNPFRVYVWDTAKRKTIYLGMFPSLNKAQLAQRAYRRGQPLNSGTKAHLRAVA